MEQVTVRTPSSPDAVPDRVPRPGVSGVGTGGGRTALHTTHYLKDNGPGGALPEDQAGLDRAVQEKHYRNEKAMEASLILVKGAPNLNGGDKITVTGVGPVFAGEWMIKTHVLTVSADGCHSALELTRNALGDHGGGSPAAVDLGTGNARVVIKPLPGAEYGES